MSNGETLYEIDNQLELLLAQVCNEHGELTEETEAALDDLVLAKQTKALNVARYLLGEEAEANMVKQQIVRLTERMRRHESRATWLKNYLAKHLGNETTGVFESHSDGAVQIGWRKSQRVALLETDAIPEEHIVTKTTRTINKASIKRVIKEGKKVAGAALSEHWNIQVK